MAEKRRDYALLDDDGREVPDPTPLSLPAGFKRPETLAEQVQRLVRGALSRQAAEQGFETWEESEDFDVGDDDDPHTPYEQEFDPVLGREVSPDQIRRDPERFRREFMEKAVDHPDTDAAVERVEKKRSRGRPRRQLDVEKDVLGVPASETRKPRPARSEPPARRDEGGEPSD